jgi:hypothetical protein
MRANAAGRAAVLVTTLAAPLFADAGHAKFEVIDGLVALVNAVLFVVGACMFVPWLRRALACAVALADLPELRRHRDRSVFWAFAIPVVSLFRPYQMVRVLDQAMDPLSVAEPPASPADLAASSSQLPSRRRPYLKRPPVGPWWAFWLFASFFGMVAAGSPEASPGFDIAIAAAGVIAAICADQVVTRLTARIVELARRKGRVPLTPAS